MEPLLLASQSPRRLELLKAAGFDVVAEHPDIDESVFDHLHVRRRVVALARAKAIAVRDEAERGNRTLPRLILGADTIVSIGEHAFGKPRDLEDARRMIGAISGRSHEVCTGSCIIDARSGRESTRLSRTVVRFRRLGVDEIERYLRTGEWRDVAGAYRIQESASLFVTRISGSYSGIVGLSLSDIYDMLRGFDVS